MVGEFKRYSREKQFFNRESEENARARVDEYARVLRCAQRFYEDLVMSYSRGRHVLEYGCGEGEWACRIAENGASSVTAFDLSEARVEIAQEKARNRHLDNVHFLVANAEALDFEDDAFDFICGTAILHHLDLHKALSEMSRVLRPRGAAVFMEPLGHNPLVNLHRRLTPHLRTEDEHPLVVDDCKIARPFFRGRCALLRLALFVGHTVQEDQLFCALNESTRCRGSVFVRTRTPFEEIRLVLRGGIYSKAKLTWA